MKRVFTLTFALLLVVGLSVSSLAARSSVTYEGGAEKFVFLPGSEYTDSDLFDNFKNVMPGDVLTQTIRVDCDAATSDYVDIYMRAVPHDEEDNPLSEEVAEKETLVSMTDFLSQLYMTVKNENTVIYEASPDELDGLERNVLLGTFQKGSSTTLTVVLTVPIELGNEYAHRVGEVDWIFSAEEFNIAPDKPEPGREEEQPSTPDGDEEPENPSEPDVEPEPGVKPTEGTGSPHTGDDNQIGRYIAAFAFGFVLVICAFILLRKKQKD